MSKAVKKRERVAVDEKKSQVRFLAKGSYGTVWENETDNKGSTVIKRMLYSEHNTIVAFSESAFYRRLGLHPGITHYVSTTIKSGGIDLCLERCDGDLFDLMETACFFPSAGFQMPVVSIMYQLACAVAHCHSCGVVHCDVKPANILYRVRKNNQIQVSLCDFGNAALVHPLSIADSAIASRTTPLYRSPHSVSHSVDDDDDSKDKNKNNNQGSMASIDIWSLGMVFYQMLMNKGPLFPIMDGDPNQKLLLENSTFFATFPLPGGHRMTPEIYHLVSSMLIPDATLRPTAESIVRYSLFSSIRRARKQTPDVSHCQYDFLVNHVSMATARGPPPQMDSLRILHKNQTHLSPNMCEHTLKETFSWIFSVLGPTRAQSEPIFHKRCQLAVWLTYSFLSRSVVQEKEMMLLAGACLFLSDLCQSDTYTVLSMHVLRQLLVPIVGSKRASRLEEWITRVGHVLKYELFPVTTWDFHQHTLLCL